MSATNSTPNYNLPIFTETDKPAWLVDFNGAMRSIDAQMKTNADAIATKSPILTFNDTADIDFTKSGDIITANLASAVSDKVGRALVTPVAAPTSDQIVGINTLGQQSAFNIGNGLSISDNVINAIDLNLTDIGTATISGLPSGVSINGGSLKFALNADHSIGKLYGVIVFRSTSTTNQVVNAMTDIKVKAPTDNIPYSISPGGLVLREGNYAYSNFGFNISASGDVSISTTAFANVLTAAYIFPCIYFFTNFNDSIN